MMLSPPVSFLDKQSSRQDDSNQQKRKKQKSTSKVCSGLRGHGVPGAAVGWGWLQRLPTLPNTSKKTRHPLVRSRGEDSEYITSKRIKGEGKRWLSGDRFNHIKRVIAPTETFAPSGFDPFFIHISFHFSPFVDTRWGNQYQSE